MPSLSRDTPGVSRGDKHAVGQVASVATGTCQGFTNR